MFSLSCSLYKPQPPPGGGRGGAPRRLPASLSLRLRPSVRTRIFARPRLFATAVLKRLCDGNRLGLFLDKLRRIGRGQLDGSMTALVKDIAHASDAHGRLERQRLHNRRRQRTIQLDLCDET